MKKIFCFALILLAYTSAQSQVTDTTKPAIITPPASQNKMTTTNWKKMDLSSRSNDHLVIQYGFDKWSGTPDTINQKGFSRFFNMYVMLDQPFKTNPKFSAGIGLGVGSSNIFFKRESIDVKSTGTKLPFARLDSSTHFKKYKLTTVFLEAPVELRYSSHPEDDNKSFKAALGVKVGLLVNAHTKGKTLEDKNGTTLNSYIAKESSKKFFNSTRLAATARIGYGIVSLYGAYQITALLKDGVGPVIHPYSIGLCISGL